MNVLVFGEFSNSLCENLSKKLNIPYVALDEELSKAVAFDKMTIVNSFTGIWQVINENIHSHLISSKFCFGTDFFKRFSDNVAICIEPQEQNEFTEKAYQELIEISKAICFSKGSLDETIYNAVSNLNLKEETCTMTIEEAIQKAIDEMEQEKSKVPEETSNLGSIELKPEKSTKAKPVVMSEEIDVKEPEQVVYAKVENNKFVLLIPKSTTLETMKIGGETYLTFSSQVVDFSKEGQLQELKIITEKKEPEKKQVVKVRKSTPRQKEIVPNESLETLLDQKKEIDLQIKNARADGKKELVETLRKRRRILRKHINAWSQNND